MEPIQTLIGVYIKADQNNCIVAIQSDLFIADTSGWLKIDEGHGDRYAHAQGSYLPGPVRNEYGIPLWRYDPEWECRFVERTGMEIEADYDALPDPPQSEEEKLKIRLQATEDALLFLMDLQMMGGMF